MTLIRFNKMCSYRLVTLLLTIDGLPYSRQVYTEHNGLIRLTTMDTLPDGGCRAAVIGPDKVKCGTPSFEESTVSFSSALTMMPTQSDICWYNSVATLPGQYWVATARWHINLDSLKNVCCMWQPAEKWENGFSSTVKSVSGSLAIVIRPVHAALTKVDPEMLMEAINDGARDLRLEVMSDSP